MKITGILKMLANRRDREKVYSTSEYWDSKAVQFDGPSVSQWPNPTLSELYDQEENNVLVSSFPILKGKSVLDAGCGTGRWSRYLAGLGADVVGIDFSENAIEIARNKQPTEHIEYRVQSILDISDVGSYDIILSSAVVTLACKNEADFSAAMQAFYRALLPSGEMLLIEPFHKGFLHRVLNLKLDDALKLIEKAGFEIVDVTELHFWPARLMLSYFAVPAWITEPVYNAGQSIMNMLSHKSLGDYKAIHVRKR